MTCTAQLRCQGSSEVPPALVLKGSKPPPMPALEQNSAIGPNCASVSSMTCKTSFSLPTSHLKAAPSIGVATARAPSGLISTTTTLAAPARWKASDSALPMPLAPPVTTTTFPVTCMVVLPSLLFFSQIFSAQHKIDDRRVMAGGAGEHEAVPDRVLKAQPFPSMEDHAETVQHAARDNEIQRHSRQRLHHRIVQHHAAPAHRQIKPDREPVVASGQH